MQLDDVPSMGERSAVVQGVAIEAEAGVATAKEYLEGVGTEAAQVVYPS
jgi:hypothetical protein